MKTVINFFIGFVAFLIAGCLCAIKITSPHSIAAQAIEGLQTVLLFLAVIYCLDSVSGYAHARKSRAAEDSVPKAAVAAGLHSRHDPNAEDADCWRVLDNILRSERACHGPVQIVFILHGRKTAIRVEGDYLPGAAQQLKSHIEALDAAAAMARAVDAHNQSKELYREMNGGPA